MSTVISVIMVIIAIAVFLFFFAFAVIGIQYLVWFHWRGCKHCGHTMEYRGLKDDNDNGHYLFHCPHCGAWQQIPKEQFFRDIENCNPNDAVI